MGEFLNYIAIFEIISDLFNVFIGSSLIFGALKWRKGLLSATALYWGFTLGLTSGIFITYAFDISPIFILFMIVLMAIGFPFQLNSIKKQGYSYDTPIITFETDNPDMHGKIIS